MDPILKDRATMRDALRAIIARVQHDFDDPALDPYREIIECYDAGPTAAAVDCQVIAERALGMLQSPHTIP